MELHAIGGCDGAVCIFLRFELDESILALHHDIGNISIFSVEFAEMALVNAVTDTADIHLDRFFFQLLVVAVAVSSARIAGVVAALTLSSLVIVFVLVLGVTVLLVPAWRVPAISVLGVLHLPVVVVVLVVIPWVWLLIVPHGLLVLSGHLYL